jgi:DNA invertase Pin-like site-specific DNA recombinase
MNGSRAVAYLRRSRVDQDRPGVVSWETQLQAVRTLAAAHGDDLTDDAILGERDWGRSGRSKTHLRPDYARMRELIEAGEVRAIYSYNLSRLARSVVEIKNLAELCRDQNVAIRLSNDVSPDLGTASGRMMLSILASVAEWQADVASEAAKAAVKVRKDAGLRQGRLPYGSRPGEDPSKVREAFLEAGSYSGAATLLNVRGVPTSATTRRHHRATNRDRLWHASAVSWIIQHQFPDDAPASPERGVRSRSHATLGRLLVCWCGRRLTSTQPARGRMTYRCDRGPIDPEHPRPYVVSESMVLQGIREEIEARFHPPTSVEANVDTASQRAILDDQRRRLTLDWVRSGLGEEAVQSELHRIDDELARLDKQQRVYAVPAIDWSWPPQDLNAALRLVLDGIRLGRDLRPESYDWGIPEWVA